MTRTQTARYCLRGNRNFYIFYNLLRVIEFFPRIMYNPVKGLKLRVKAAGRQLCSRPERFRTQPANIGVVL